MGGIDTGENREFVDPTEFRVASQSYRLPLDTERRGSLVKSDELVLALAAVQRQEILAQEPEGLVLSIVSGGHRVVARRRHLALKSVSGLSPGAVGLARRLSFSSGRTGPAV